MINYLQVENLSKSFGDVILFKNISFTISQGEKVALIARNGAGKTTLLDIIMGKDKPDSGQVVFRNSVKTTYLSQSPIFNKNHTVLQAAMHGEGEVLKTIQQYEIALAHDDVNQMNALHDKITALNAWNFESDIKKILQVFKINDFDQPIHQLSGGQKKRIALANTLINKPDFLILDEPTNHLDLAMIEWLEQYLEKERITLLMVTHDRYFLDNVCSDILELDNKTLFRYKGNYSYFLEKKQERMENEAASMDRAKNLYRKEIEWVRKMPRARGTKAKYRMDAFDELKKVVDQKKDNINLKIQLNARRLGTKVLKVDNVNKAYGTNNLIDDFSHTFERFTKTGIIGANGSGKTTLLNVLCGKLNADSGVIDFGETVEIGYYTQEGVTFDENKRVIDIVKDFAEIISLANGSQMSASQYLSFWLFPPEVQYSIYNKLSGGEKRRLYLLTVLLKNPNFLVLDEPTNDLDIETLNVLEEFLDNYQGSVMIVSHDRYFMDKVAERLLVFDGNGKISVFEGSYTMYYLTKEKELEDSKPSKATSTNVNTTVQAIKPAKLSFKEKMEYEQLEKDIAVLEQQKLKLEEKMNSGDASHEELNEDSQKYNAILKQIDEKSMRWIELADRLN